jgi:hypothetical protein
MSTLPAAQTFLGFVAIFIAQFIAVCRRSK